MAGQLDDILREEVTIKRTLLNDGRLHRLAQLASGLECVEGDVIEVGVYKGGSAKFLCETFPRRRVYLFDTFSGMPAPDKIDGHAQGDFKDTSLESVKHYLRDCPNAVIRAGMFPQTTEGLEETQFCFAHIDCDLYASTKAAIEFIWPRLSEGGVMVFDDYKSQLCKGATQAVNEFVEWSGVNLEGVSPREAAVVRK